MNDRSLPAFHRLVSFLRGVRSPCSCAAQFHGCPSNVGDQRLHLGEQLLAPGHRERPDHPDRGQHAALVVQPEQQRADGVRAGLVHPVAGDHAVAGALVLDLGHHPLVGLVGLVELLGDQPVQPGPLELLEPGPRQLVVVGDRGEVDRRLAPGPAPAPAGPAARRTGARSGPRRRAPAGRTRRSWPGSRAASRFTRLAAGWMRCCSTSNSSELRSRSSTTISPSITARSREVGQHRVDHLREVAGHRALVAAADLHLVAVPEDDRAEAVPLRLVELAGGDGGDAAWPASASPAASRAGPPRHPARPTAARRSGLPPDAGDDRSTCAATVHRAPSWRRPARARSPTCCPGPATRRCGCCSAASTRAWSARPPGTTSRGRATGSGRRCTAPGSPRGGCGRPSRASWPALGLGDHQPGRPGHRPGRRAHRRPSWWPAASGCASWSPRTAPGLAGRRRDHRLPHGVRRARRAVGRAAGRSRSAAPGSGCCPTPAA